MELSGFLSLTLILWVLQTSMPAIDKILPTLSIIYPPDAALLVRINSGQILNIFVGLGTFISFYCLFSTVSQRRKSSKETSTHIFFVCQYLVMTGMGMHTVCVILEEEFGQTLDIEAVRLIHFLHEYLSHWMFMNGFYTSLFVIIFVEAKPSTIKSKEVVSPCGWVWPLLMGLYLAVFSTLTSTSLPTAIFFAGVLCFSFKVSGLQYRYVSSFLNKTSIFGLPSVIILTVRSYITTSGDQN